MNSDTKDAVMVTLDFHESIMLCNIYLSEYSSNKLKLMYGYSYHQLDLAFVFNYVEKVLSFMDDTFCCVRSSDKNIYMFPFSSFNNMLQCMKKEYDIHIEDEEKFFRIINVASSNIESEQWVYDTHANNNSK